MRITGLVIVAATLVVAMIIPPAFAAERENALQFLGAKQDDSSPCWVTEDGKLVCEGQFVDDVPEGLMAVGFSAATSYTTWQGHPAAALLFKAPNTTALAGFYLVRAKKVNSWWFGTRERLMEGAYALFKGWVHFLRFNEGVLEAGSVDLAADKAVSPTNPLEYWNTRGGAGQ